ncbi:sce7726 family protein [Pseudomonas putida]|uniref:sce7726 family protein n=1 Tax=Pseudomonas putida TaxID=303 RepID=UPI002363A50A|nr:sce7726 family protein [Pseudomonas putida]MDD2024938.1 sce7726 family protein [Pseudomonas putida]HDS1765324.1 sce7726 family protein [Pseudomonas putida]
MREAAIKRALAHHLDGVHGSAPRTLLEELPLNGGEIRADVVDVDDLHCYEIKSEGDSLKRLLGQGARYARVFDHVTLVTTQRHLKKAMPMLPKWWGILLVPETEDASFKQVRVAKLNKGQEPEVLATLLKRDDCLSILELRGSARGWRSKSLYMLQDHVASLLTLDELRSTVRTYLMRRGGADHELDRHDLFSTAL